MKYSEYRVRDSGLEKRLGVLGEIHMYDSDESKFAEEIVPTYDAIGMEGSGKPSSVFLITILHTLPLITYMAATGRYRPSALVIAEKRGKEIIRLEESEDTSFSFTQKLALALTGLIGTAMAPYSFFYYLKHGDPLVEGTEAYKRRQKRLQENGLCTRLSNYAVKDNLALRDTMMADNVVKVIQNRSDNLLVVCGKLHFEGVVSNLQNKLDMEEKASLIS